MKIAFPTMDGKSISAHFGRSKAFLVLEVVDGRIQHREVRENNQASQSHSHGAAAPGTCQSGVAQEKETHGHDHGAFARLLQDCQLVVVIGMGAGAVRAIAQAGIKVCRVEEGCTPEEALLRLAGNNLPELTGGSCGCTSHH